MAVNFCESVQTPIRPELESVMADSLLLFEAGISLVDQDCMRPAETVQAGAY